MNIVLLFVQQHETSCFLELSEQDQWWVPGEQTHPQSHLNSINCLPHYHNCYILTLLLYLSCVSSSDSGRRWLQAEPGPELQHRGSLHRKLSLGWAGGSSAHRPKDAPSFGSFSEPWGSPTTLPDSLLHTPFDFCLSASDPKTHFLQDPKTFLVIKTYTDKTGVFSFSWFVFKFKLSQTAKLLYPPPIMFLILMSPQCLLNVAN